MIKLDLKDFEKLVKKVKEAPERLTKIINADVKTAAIFAELEAKILVPKNLGNLRNSISVDKVEDLKYRITASEPYAPFVEFGTGGNVDVPKGFEDFAKQFKGSGKGSFEEGLEAIKAWCRNKGIPETAAYPIFMSILKEGIEPQPYLIPAAKLGQRELFKNLTATFNEFEL